MRLRTRFLLSMLLVTAGLTTISLVLVQRSIHGNVRQSIAVNLRNSVNSFQDFRHERETMLTSEVALVADLPLTRAIMTSTDPVTIQDASQDVWQHARSTSDLFVLVNRSGNVVALHTKSPGFTPEDAQKFFQQSLDVPALRAIGGSENIISTRPSYNRFIADRVLKERSWGSWSSATRSTTGWLRSSAKSRGDQSFSPTGTRSSRPT